MTARPRFAAEASRYAVTLAHDDALEETILLLANEILSDACARMSYAALQFVRQGSPAPGRKSQAGVSKVWEAAKAAAAPVVRQLSPNIRSKKKTATLLGGGPA